MKYFFTISLIFISLILVAQSGTTLDEYRYLSKGYAYHLEMGLDPAKKGYEIRKNYEAQNGTSIIGLYLTNAKTPQGLLLITTDNLGKSYYQALPHPQSATNVLALYRQDQAQYLPKVVLDKMAEAKNHYLFMIPTTNQSEDLVQNQVSNSTAPMKFSENQTTNRPSSYEDSSQTANDRLTTKGGNTILPQKKESSGALAEKRPLGTTITGKLNAALSTRSILILPNAENTSPAKGRVMIKFCANADGSVTYAKFTQRGSTTHNSQLKAVALAAVRKMRLASTDGSEDCGTVGFDF